MFACELGNLVSKFILSEAPPSAGRSRREKKVKNSMNFLNPEDILSTLSLKENMMASEFGCGSGDFSLAMAERLKQGKVYAMDIQEEPLSVLKSRALERKLQNLDVVHCDLEKKKGSKLADGCLDLVLVSNVLFQVRNKKAFLKEAKRVLKPEGRLLVVDWISQAPFGPGTNTIAPAEVREIAKSLDLKFENEFDAGGYHYGLVFAKK